MPTVKALFDVRQLKWIQLYLLQIEQKIAYVNQRPNLPVRECKTPQKNGCEGEDYANLKQSLNSET